MRLSGGIGDNMSHTLGTRSILDYLYFLLVLVVLLNIVFGIIIDTFSELRGDKNERVAKTIGFCFICGWEKLKFDQVTDTHKQAHAILSTVTCTHYHQVHQQVTPRA